MAKREIQDAATIGTITPSEADAAIRKAEKMLVKSSGRRPTEGRRSARFRSPSRKGNAARGHSLEA